eukprot:5996739-Amphidinium_carterae.1
MIEASGCGSPMSSSKSKDDTWFEGVHGMEAIGNGGICELASCMGALTIVASTDCCMPGGGG